MDRRRLEPSDPRHLVEVALRYAQHGWPVLPLHTPRPQACSCGEVDCGSPGKHPRTRRGLHDASTDSDRIRHWWARWPQANVGVATGATSRLVVLDVDLPDGPASLARLESEHGPLPPTCEQRTGSGGRQLLFARPDSPVGNRARLLAGVDVRADGGYIVVPPSIHATGGRYRWTKRIPPVEPPGWLASLMDRTRTADDRTAAVDVPDLPLPASSRQQRYAAAAMRDELARLAAAFEGTRNATLNRAAFSLGQLVATGLLDHDHVAGELARVATDIGLGDREIRRTVTSGLSAGLNQPRAVPAPPTRRPASEPATSPSVPVRQLGARRR